MQKHRLRIREIWTKFGPNMKKKKRNVRKKMREQKTVKSNRKVRSDRKIRRKNSKSPKRKSSKSRFRTPQGVTKARAPNSLDQ